MTTTTTPSDNDTYHFNYTLQKHYALNFTMPNLVSEFGRPPESANSNSLYMPHYTLVMLRVEKPEYLVNIIDTSATADPPLKITGWTATLPDIQRRPNIATPHQHEFIALLSSDQEGSLH